MSATAIKTKVNAKEKVLEDGATGSVIVSEMPAEVRKSYMYSSWHRNTSLTKLIWENPLKALLYDLMFRGEVKRHEGKLPVLRNIDQHLFVFPRTLPPLAIQWISMKLGYTWPLPVAVAVYVVYFIIFSKLTLIWFNNLMSKYGFLDQNVPRDQVPDHRVNATAIGIIATVLVRPMLVLFTAYDRYEVPHVSPWILVHVFMYSSILDFYYYIYHRAMHESEFLWKFHKTHHMTKHPSSVLSAFASNEQDLFDIFIIPLITSMTYRMDFHTWWIASVYVIFVEASGHSGLRAFVQNPISSPILTYFDMDLALEDHDLHHRQGWRKSSNYGKQTRIWDKLFGTTRPRVECVPGNIDW